MDSDTAAVGVGDVDVAAVGDGDTAVGADGSVEVVPGTRLGIVPLFHPSCAQYTRYWPGGKLRSSICSQRQSGLLAAQGMLPGRGAVVGPGPPLFRSTKLVSAGSVFESIHCPLRLTEMWAPSPRRAEKGDVAGVGEGGLAAGSYIDVELPPPSAG